MSYIIFIYTPTNYNIYHDINILFSIVGNFFIFFIRRSNLYTINVKLYFGCVKNEGLVKTKANDYCSSHYCNINSYYCVTLPYYLIFAKLNLI